MILSVEPGGRLTFPFILLNEPMRTNSFYVDFNADIE